MGWSSLHLLTTLAGDRKDAQVLALPAKGPRTVTPWLGERGVRSQVWLGENTTEQWIQEISNGQTHWTDPEKTWEANSSVATSLGVRWDSVPFSFWWIEGMFFVLFLESWVKFKVLSDEWQKLFEWMSLDLFFGVICFHHFHHHLGKISYVFQTSYANLRVWLEFEWWVAN